MVRKQEAERLKRSWSRGTAITIVRFGLNVRATLNTRGNSIAKRRKKPVKSAEVKVNDRKQKSLLDKYKLKYEDISDNKLSKKKRGKK